LKTQALQRNAAAAQKCAAKTGLKSLRTYFFSRILTRKNRNFLDLFLPLQPLKPRAAARSGGSKNECASALRHIPKPCASALQRVPIPAEAGRLDYYKAFLM
jgi:hypothetical protein